MFINFGTSKTTIETLDVAEQTKPEMRGIQEMSVIPNHVGVTNTMSDYPKVLSICVLMKKSLMAA